MRINGSFARAAPGAALLTGLCASQALAQCPNSGSAPPAWSTSRGSNLRDSTNTNET
ncbi:MAG: hypothetical protein ACLP59_19080 [Bryobacteraceae bacterium]